MLFIYLFNSWDFTEAKTDENVISWNTKNKSESF